MTSGAGRDQLGAARLPWAEVSIICTARNVASTIVDTTRRIQAQDSQKWEMITVDDGSTDDTVSIVNGFTQADPRIRLVATGGIGRGRALNRALAEAETDLVTNIDRDNECHPWRLRCQLEAMKRYPDFPLIFTESVIVYGAAAPIWPEIDTSAPGVVADITRGLAVHNPVVRSSAMMRKAVILELGGYDEERRFVFDYDLWVRCAAAGLPLGRLQLPLGGKRIHPGQSCLCSSRLPYFFARVSIQIRAIRALGVRPRFSLIVIRVIWGVLPPRSARANLSRLRSAFRRICSEHCWKSP